ncbi:MAG: small subunit ribosomal protein [Candidatus Dependentiae bacterium]|nr:small subunit ribosomal protein [Candidatus Dependentiae bacterium]
MPGADKGLEHQLTVNFSLIRQTKVNRLMAVRIRLSRAGTTNRPYWRIVAVDSRKKRDGACLDRLGTYDPILHQIITLNDAGIQEWVSKGALCSPAVTKLVKKHASVAGKIAQSAVEEAPKKVTRRPKVSAEAAKATA